VADLQASKIQFQHFVESVRDRSIREVGGFYFPKREAKKFEISLCSNSEFYERFCSQIKRR